MVPARPDEDTARLSSALSGLPPPQAVPFMVLICGLPGSGKSYLARCLAEKLPAVILQSDALRKALFGKPAYTPGESGRLFQAMRHVAAELLAKRIPVIIDATNVTERDRRCFTRIADRLGVKTIIAHTHAPTELVKERLAERPREPLQMSEAGWEVHESMRKKFQKVKREHFDIDTSADIGPAVERIVHEVTKPAIIANLCK